MTSTSASRQARSARNALAEALGLGESYPLRDLPVTAEPPVASYGSIARVGGFALCLRSSCSNR